MTSYKGRDLLLKIGDGEALESFTTIGAARALELTLDNRGVDATAMDAAGVQALELGAGMQTMQVVLQGIFKDAAAEEALRAAAFARAHKNYQLIFPNGDRYEAAFVIESYARGGSAEGLETFSAMLRRSGTGVFTPGA